MGKRGLCGTESAKAEKTEEVDQTIKSRRALHQQWIVYACRLDDYDE